MGMANVYRDTRIRSSTLYPDCLYCPRCRAIYRPNQEWGYVFDRYSDDTSGHQSLYGIHRKGRECPMCGNSEGVGDE